MVFLSEESLLVGLLSLTLVISFSYCLEKMSHMILVCCLLHFNASPLSVLICFPFFKLVISISIKSQIEQSNNDIVYVSVSYNVLNYSPVGCCILISLFLILLLNITLFIAILALPLMGNVFFYFYSYFYLLKFWCKVVYCAEYCSNASPSFYVSCSIPTMDYLSWQWYLGQIIPCPCNDDKKRHSYRLLEDLL